MLSFMNNIIIANAAEKIAGTVQAYVGPILLLIIGIIAITFLFRRQVTQFLTFAIIAIVVAIFFYAPGVIVGIARAFTGETGLDQGTTGW